MKEGKILIYLSLNNDFFNVSAPFKNFFYEKESFVYLVYRTD